MDSVDFICQTKLRVRLLRLVGEARAGTKNVIFGDSICSCSSRYGICTDHNDKLLRPSRLFLLHSRLRTQS